MAESVGELGAFLGELREVDVLVGVLLAVLLAAHLHEECVVGHAALWLL